ncbi:MAG TPA: hypothetical protein VI544_02425 [Candidatus Nanoarchaeia archaeon]|nr:hypothetical protein [Candidatus Nanoarchaeia archaeon]
MKERISATIDPETRKIIDKALESGRYRNLSHFIEDIIKSWKEKK